MNDVLVWILGIALALLGFGFFKRKKKFDKKGALKNVKDISLNDVYYNINKWLTSYRKSK